MVENNTALPNYEIISLFCCQYFNNPEHKFKDVRVVDEHLILQGRFKAF